MRRLLSSVLERCLISGSGKGCVDLKTVCMVLSVSLQSWESDLCHDSCEVLDTSTPTTTTEKGPGSMRTVVPEDQDSTSAA